MAVDRARSYAKDDRRQRRNGHAAARQAPNRVLLYPVSDALDDFFHHAPVIPIRLVVPEPHHAPMRPFGIPTHLDDAVVDLLARLFPPCYYA